jgi:hypothetical protein
MKRTYLEGAMYDVLFPKSCGRMFFSLPFWRYPPFRMKFRLSTVVMVELAQHDPNELSFTIARNPASNIQLLPAPFPISERYLKKSQPKEKNPNFMDVLTPLPQVTSSLCRSSYPLLAEKSGRG